MAYTRKVFRDATNGRFVERKHRNQPERVLVRRVRLDAGGVPVRVSAGAIEVDGRFYEPREDGSYAPCRRIRLREGGELPLFES